MPRPGERDAASGDRVGFDDFFLSEHPRLVAMALALTGVPEVAVDIAQEALTRALRDWDRVCAMDAPAAWVRRVAVNLVNDWHRSNVRFARFAPRLVTASSVEMADPESERFWQAVRDLPDLQRSVVALHYLEDRSVAEIAALLDVPEGTVKSSLYRARAALAKVLGVNAGDPDDGGSGVRGLRDDPAGPDSGRWAP